VLQNCTESTLLLQTVQTQATATRQCHAKRMKVMQPNREKLCKGMQQHCSNSLAVAQEKVQGSTLARPAMQKKLY
jgi:hypothetical protein